MYKNIAEDKRKTSLLIYMNLLPSKLIETAFAPVKNFCTSMFYCNKFIQVYGDLTIFVCVLLATLTKEID